MRGIKKFLLTLIPGLLIIWLGFWWYAEGRLQSGFTDWAELLASNGWKISYDSLRRGTSPLHAEVTIDNLTAAGPVLPSGQAAQIALPSVTLRIDAFDPLVFHTDLPTKIAMTLSNGLYLVFDFGSIALSENLDPNKLFNRHTDPFRGGDFSARDLDILASQGSLLVLHLDAVASHVDLNPSASAAQTAIATRTSFDGAALSPLLTRIAALPFQGRLAHLELTARFSGPVPPNLPDVLDQAGATPGQLDAQEKLLAPLAQRWAAQGGSADLKLAAVLGPTTLNAGATLGFDASQQPQGNAHLEADHLDQFTAALAASYPALEADMLRAEAQLSPYLTNSPQTGQTLAVQLSFGKPGVVVNGQRLGDMPPLDWQALENPPPAPPASATNGGMAGQ